MNQKEVMNSRRGTRTGIKQFSTVALIVGNKR